MLQLEKIKLYLRIDDDSEDTLLSSFEKTSREEIKISTGVESGSKASETEIYELTQLILISDMYENRSIEDGEYKANNKLSRLYTKLKYGFDENEKLS